MRVKLDAPAESSNSHNIIMNTTVDYNNVVSNNVSLAGHQLLQKSLSGSAVSGIKGEIIVYSVLYGFIHKVLQGGSRIFITAVILMSLTTISHFKNKWKMYIVLRRNSFFSRFTSEYILVLSSNFLKLDQNVTLSTIIG